MSTAPDHSNPLWPFAGPCYQMPHGPLQTYKMAASDRVDAVKRMDDPEQLSAALRVPGLQKSVEIAIRRRLKLLEACAA